MNGKPKIPLYLWAEERIRNDITSGFFKEGELIPTEKELARKYGVSPGTVRRAALNLKQKGLLYRVQGKGTSVVFDEYNSRRYRNYRFIEGLKSDLEPVIIAFLNLEVIQAKGDIAGNLRVRKGSKVIRLERLGKIADRFLLHTLSFLPKNLHKGLEKYTAEQFLKNTLWKIQEIHLGISIEKREEFLSIVKADEQMAKVLDIESGSPVLRIESILTSSIGHIIEYRISHCNIGHLKFYVCQELF